MIGGGALAELREALAEAELAGEGGVSPRVSPFADVRDGGDLLQRAGFALPVADRERIGATYEHAFGLMIDLRHMGETNAVCARRKSFTRRATLVEAAEVYLRRFADRGGRLRATFDILFLTGWAPGPGPATTATPGQRRNPPRRRAGRERSRPGGGPVKPGF